MKPMINRKYKDSLFQKLFGEDKNNALSLYNALNNSDYTDPDELTITTIDDVVYMGIKNDTSYLIDGNLQLTEHQSAYNPNMPIRGLMYFGKLYDQYISSLDDTIYGHKLIKLPNPRYYVLYNGDDDCPERLDLKLSDAFVHPDDSHRYEWTATMLNINSGHNYKLMKACKALDEYSLFIAKVKELKQLEKSSKDAIIKAVDYCIDNNILKECLLKNKSEVIDMVLTEYDEEKTMSALKKQYLNQGIRQGISQGKTSIIVDLISQNLLTKEQGAKQLGIPVAELEKLLEK